MHWNKNIAIGIQQNVTEISESVDIAFFAEVDTLIFFIFW